MRTELDGGDLEKTLQKHQRRKKWLQEAKAYLEMTAGPQVFRRSDYYGWEGFDFTIEVPQSVWEPQLREQIAQLTKDVSELDSIARRYFEAALSMDATKTRA